MDTITIDITHAMGRYEGDQFHGDRVLSGKLWDLLAELAESQGVKLEEIEKIEAVCNVAGGDNG